MLSKCKGAVVMKLNPHIVIIGGGLIGLSCADALLAAGAKVTILELTAETGLGASQFNSAMIHASQANPWMSVMKRRDASASVYQLAVRSRELLQAKRKMLKCDDFARAPGTVQLFDDRVSYDLACTGYEYLQLLHYDYSGPWCFGKRALTFPQDESGDAHHYCQLLLKDLLDKGCVVSCGAQSELVLRRNRCVGVRLTSTKEYIACDGVIIAIGAKSTDYLKAYDVRLPVFPVQGHALLFDRPPGLTAPEIPIMHWNSHSALTVFEDHIRLSGTVGVTEPSELHSIWEKVMPDFIRALGAPKKEWSANRPMSKHGRPFIAPTEIPGLWVNSGHGHMGWSLCAASGELMAEMILNGREAAEFSLAESG